MHVLCMLASIISTNTQNNHRHAVCCGNPNVIANKSKIQECLLLHVYLPGLGLL